MQAIKLRRGKAGLGKSQCVDKSMLQSPLRRFEAATGYAPLDYVLSLRM